MAGRREQDVNNNLLGFVIGLCSGFMVAFAVTLFSHVPVFRYHRACATIYARSVTTVDSLQLARQSGCPFKVEP